MPIPDYLDSSAAGWYDSDNNTIVIARDLIINKQSGEGAPTLRFQRNEVDLVTLYVDSAGVLKIPQISFDSDVNILGTLTVDSDTTIHGNLTVDSDTTIHGDLIVDSDTTIHGTLTVDSDTTIQGDLSVNSIIGDVDITGSLTINNKSVGPIVAYKKNDETRTSTTTPADDSDLFFTLAANDIVGFRIVFLINAGTTPDFKFTMKDSSNSTTTAIFGYDAGVDTGPSTNFGSVVTISGGAIDEISFADGFIQNGSGGPTNIRLQWSQDATSGTATTLKKGSYIIATKLN